MTTTEALIVNNKPDPTVLENLLNNQEYSTKALPKTPQSVLTLEQQCEGVKSAIRKITFLKEPPPCIFEAKDSLRQMEGERMETLLKTIHMQNIEIEQLKSKIQQGSHSHLPSNDTPSQQTVDQVDMLKALCTKVTQELKKSFIALKIAHNQLQEERKNNAQLTSELHLLKAVNEINEENLPENAKQVDDEDFLAD